MPEGYLQTDGYAAYANVCAKYGLRQLGCWAHVRRKFDETLKSQGKMPSNPNSLAHQALQIIQKLYRIEAEIRDLSPEQKHRIRQDKALPILNDMKTWLDRTLTQVTPSSLTGNALSYLAKQWPTLTVYCKDGRLEIDNNSVERAIRPFVIGRNNWLFSDTVNGANASANLYSLIETAKLNGLTQKTGIKKRTSLTNSGYLKTSYADDFEQKLLNQPNNPDILYRLANIYLFEAGNSNEKGDFKSAEENYKKAIERCRRLLQLQSQNPDVLFLSANIFESFGLLLKNQNRTREAMKAYLGGLVFSEKFFQVSPSRAEAIQQQASIYKQLGDIHLSNNDSKKAQEFYKNAVNYAEQLIKDHPDIVWVI